MTTLTELTGVPDTGMEVLQCTELKEVSGRYGNVVPVPPVLWHGRP